jgi:hypothetical protein
MLYPPPRIGTLSIPEDTSNGFDSHDVLSCAEAEATPINTANKDLTNIGEMPSFIASLLPPSFPLT